MLALATALLGLSPGPHRDGMRVLPRQSCPARGVAVRCTLSPPQQPPSPQEGDSPRSVSLQDLLNDANTKLEKLYSPPATKAPEQRMQRERSSDAAVASEKSMSVAWVVLGKQPVRDQLSLELGTRVHAAISRLRTGDEVPSLICFCGAELADPLVYSESKAEARSGVKKPYETPPAISGAALAYNFFRVCAEAQGVDLRGIHFVVDNHDSLRHGIEQLSTCLDQTRIGRTGPQPHHLARVRVRFFGTEYQLLRLQELDTLLPRLSLLRPLHGLQAAIFFDHVSNPCAYSTQPTTSRRARRVLQAEQLQVLQVNIQGMIRTKELFQREAWNLVQHERAKLAEELLADGSSTSRQSAVDMSKDELEALEVAVASLGRVLTALRPMLDDPIFARIEQTALHEAQERLHDATLALRAVDPDRPIKPAEWLQLTQGVELVDFFASSVQ